MHRSDGLSCHDCVHQNDVVLRVPPIKKAESISGKSVGLEPKLNQSLGYPQTGLIVASIRMFVCERLTLQVERIQPLFSFLEIVNGFTPAGPEWSMLR